MHGEPSPRVRLEIALLDADEGVSDPAAPAAHDEARRIVLVVSAESDLRRYVRECLRARDDLWLIEAATVGAAVALSAQHTPELIIVDAPEREILVRAAPIGAIVIVDDVPHDAPASPARIRSLVRPFSAEGLAAEVARVMG